MTMSKAFKIFLIIAAVGLVVIGAPRLYHWLASWNYRRHFDTEIVYKLTPIRGDMYDTDGNLICTSELAYDAYLDCTLLQDEDEWRSSLHSLAPELARLFPERGAAEWWQYIQDGRDNGKKYLKIAKNLSGEKKAALRQLPIFMKGRLVGGAIFEQHYRRILPYGNLASRTIGYARNGEVGVGLEKGFERELHGIDGHKVVQYGHYQGEGMRREKETVSPQRGLDIHTTLSMRLQAAADSALRKAVSNEAEIEAACLVLMDVSSGAIRAMVNLSRDPDVPGRPFGERYNYAIGYPFEPGSVVQTMTLAAALNDGYIRSLEERIPTNHGVIPGKVQDATIQDYERRHGAREISILDGFVTSSSYVPAKLATDYYSASTRYFVESLRSYCLPEDIHFDLEGLRPADFTNPQGLYWEDHTLAMMSNGFCLTLAPLDILSFYNTIANGGTMVKPYLVESVGNGKPKETGILKRSVLRQATVDSLRRALREVTLRGTGARLRDARYPISGKTASALQIISVYDPDTPGGLAKDPYHDKLGRKKTAGVYVGFFPEDRPQYSVICVVFSEPTHKNFYGGTIPAIAVRDLVNSMNTL